MNDLSLSREEADILHEIYKQGNVPSLFYLMRKLKWSFEKSNSVVKNLQTKELIEMYVK